MKRELVAFAAMAGLCLVGCDVAPVQEAAAAQPPRHQAQQGKASYYGPEFNGRRMANGERFDPHSNTAAHRTLPLGTMVRVTNLENGRSATVTVKDRGPYVRGRIIDVSPHIADRLGMKEDGVVPVQVQPVQVPTENEQTSRTQEAQR
jgi:rare lipoprotein A